MKYNIMVLCVFILFLFVLLRMTEYFFTNTTKLITVLIPLYNNDKYIGKTIESVLNQTYQNFELIIIDDKSTDNSLNIAKSYEKQNSKIKIVENSENLGVYKTLNVGFKHIKGYYFTILGSDDQFLPRRLEEDIISLSDPKYLAVISKYIRTDLNGKTVTSTQYGESMITFKTSVLKDMKGYINCRFGGDTEFQERFNMIYKNKMYQNDKLLYKSIMKTDNTNLTSKYDSYTRTIFVKYYNKLHKYYNTTISNKQNEDLKSKIKLISISEEDHIQNLIICNIKVR